MRGGFPLRCSPCVLVVLLLGAVVNLAAGVRRPLVERTELRSNYYPEADEAAAAVRQMVPAGEPLALVVYAGDKLAAGTLQELDCDVWADYRLKWLLYPRPILVYRVEADGSRRPDPRYPVPHGTPPRWELAFRVTAPPAVNAGRRPAAQGAHWVLQPSISPDASNPGTGR